MSPSSDSTLDVPTSPYLTDRTKEKTQFSIHSTEVEVKQGSVFDIEGQKSGIVRGLKSRHIQLIALGSAIGTGLFIGRGRGESVEKMNSINVQFARVEFAAVVKPKGIC